MPKINKYKHAEDLLKDDTYRMMHTLMSLGFCDLHFGHVTDNNISLMISYHYWQTVKKDSDHEEIAVAMTGI